jgi:hypothetical protein
MDAKPRFSDPPAPPPQQPLPEKPDSARNHSFDPASPSLKRTTTERPRSVPSASPIRQEPNSQILNLVEALTAAKKEIDSQGARVRDLEEMLRQEREARETAEMLAKRLELESAASKMNGVAKGGEGSIIEDAFDPPTEPESSSTPAESTTESVETSTTRLQQKLELMLTEMNEMKQQMELYRQRAETAEAERDSDRKTLAEMVDKIRSDERSRPARSVEPFSNNGPSTSVDEVRTTELVSTLETLLHKSSQDGEAKANTLRLEKPTAIYMSRMPSNDQLAYHTGPYASMLGVVLLGMGLMAYMNGWQHKIER